MSRQFGGEGEQGKEEQAEASEQDKVESPLDGMGDIAES